MPEHGGNIQYASKRFSIAPSEWLDLSTGVNPSSFPLPVLPDACWRNLPIIDDNFTEAARCYYQADELLPVPGTQCAIQLLPRLRQQPSRVGLLPLTYNEHLFNWRKHNHMCVPLLRDHLFEQSSELDVVVLCNPNNPTGEKFSIEELLKIHETLSKRGGWLIVDEAFIDCTPENSLGRLCGSQRQGLVVLRSFGKFFGLAGIRLGFVLGWEELLRRLSHEMGPWSINGPAIEIAKRALQDTEWQRSERERLKKMSTRLSDLLCEFSLFPSGGTELFKWVQSPYSNALYEFLGNRAILTRLFPSDSCFGQAESLPAQVNQASLRFGLPACDNGFNRLRTALSEFVESMRPSLVGTDIKR